MSIMPTPKRSGESLREVIETSVNNELNKARAMNGEEGVTNWQQEIRKRTMGPNSRGGRGS